ncbi:reverse transcriptase [Corchorus capsularis]|uniref:Reverse transcriptase n=1 Tax=Corchorus capsularis TaxID=210143 RepID=A0A1R3GXV3_COCAP|nr:reverse transcriptase [Corchorus capsularis]
MRESDKRRKGGWWGFNPSGYQEKESFRWRLSLHLVFVGNISEGITRKDLWDKFNDFGIVVDVFMPPRRKGGSRSFAFIRYRFQDELIRAVQRGNGMKFGGMALVVPKATVRKLDRESHGRISWERNKVRVRSDSGRFGKSENDRVQKSHWKEKPQHEKRDNAIIAVRGNNSGTTKESKEPDIQQPDGSTPMQVLQPDTVINKVADVNEEMVLISTYGNMSEVITAIQSFEFQVKVAEISNVMLLLIVNKEALVDDCIKAVNGLNLDCFIEFMSIDESTKSRNSFKQARVQTALSSVCDVPKIITGESAGIKFRIRVSLEKVDRGEWDCSGFPVPSKGQSINHDDELVLVPNSAFIDASLYDKDDFGFEENNDDCRIRITPEDIVGESLTVSREGAGRRDLLHSNFVVDSLEREDEFVPNSNSFIEHHVSEPEAHFNHSGSTSTRPSLGVRSLSGLKGVVDDFNFTKGLGRKEKRRAVRSLIARCQANLVMLQESKLDSVNLRLIKSMWGRDKFQYRVAEAIGSAGGLISIWDEDFFSVELAVVDSRYIICIGTLLQNGFRCAIGIVYAPNDEDGRLNVWRETRDLKAQFDVPWILGGDFNAVLRREERLGASGNIQGVESFSEFIGYMQLVDLPLIGAKYTSANTRDLPLFIRLDHFLVSSEILLSFPDIKQKAKPKSLSDHNRILLLVENQNWGSKPFKFFNYWLELDGFQKTFDSAWKSLNGGYDNYQRLRLLKPKIKEWFNEFGRVDLRRIEELEEEINSLELEIQVQHGSNVTELRRVILAKKNDLWNLYRMVERSWQQKAVERSWQQKARMQWLKEGDKNTKFFHLVASNRARRNRIDSIEIDGLVIEKPEDVKEGISSFFEKFYNTKTAVRVADIDCNFKRSSEERADWLERVMSAEEVYEAICECDGTKAPGPDGFNFFFIKKQWETLKGSVMEFINDFCSGANFNTNVNNSFITLVPKCNGAVKIEQFRPISLVGCLYKILAKVLSRRLKSVMQDVIGEFQFAFTQGRQILDCSLIANEIVDSMKKSKEGVLVNGSAERKFSPARGLRQGCHLSPFLFNLVGEFLSLLLSKAVDIGLFSGFQVGRVAISHLQYADDTLITFTIKQQLDRIVRRFLWSSNSEGRKIHFIDWDSICKYKDQGGLGIIDLDIMNQALLNKWLWRFGNEQGSLWQRIIVEKNGCSNSALIPAGSNRNGSAASALWKSILKPGNDGLSSMNKIPSVTGRFNREPVPSPVLDGMAISIGYGIKVDFWKDEWVEGIILKESFPRIYALVLVKNGSAADFGSFVDDEWRWVVIRKRLAVKFELNKRGLISFESSLCEKEVENVEHLFFTCICSWNIWMACCRLWGIRWVVPVDPTTFFLSWYYAIDDFSKVNVWRLIFFVVIWSLWLTRNDMVFNNKHFDALQLFDLIKLRLSWWVKAAWPDSNLSFENLFRFPDVAVVKHNKAKVPRCLTWERPTSGFLKFNVDGASKGKPGPAGIGGILRDENGRVCMEFSKSTGIMELNEDKVCAIREGLLVFCASRWVESHGLIVESDSSIAVKWVENPDESPWRLRKWINHICLLKRNFSSFKVCHIFREANHDADVLAKEGIDREAPYVRLFG